MLQLYVYVMLLINLQLIGDIWNFILERKTICLSSNCLLKKQRFKTKEAYWKERKDNGEIFFSIIFRGENTFYSIIIAVVTTVNGLSLFSLYPRRIRDSTYATH